VCETTLIREKRENRNNGKGRVPATAFPTPEGLGPPQGENQFGSCNRGGSGGDGPSKKLNSQDGKRVPLKKKVNSKRAGGQSSEVWCRSTSLGLLRREGGSPIRRRFKIRAGKVREDKEVTLVGGYRVSRKIVQKSA